MRTPLRRRAPAGANRESAAPTRTSAGSGPHSGGQRPRNGASRPAAPALSKDSEIASAIKALVLAGNRDAARERFAELVASQQRRAVRIAFNYLRDAHDADEAVQDAFFKVFTHITTYREELPFEVWFTRILVNGCLDLRKARARRLRWTLPVTSLPDSPPTPDPVATDPSPEERLVSGDQARRIAAAVEQLPDRQRTVFTLCHIAEQTTNEVSQALGLSEATVRVHLFRAVRKLRKLLSPRPVTASEVTGNDAALQERSMA